MFPIPLPWLIISAIVALFGTYQVGHHYGWLERDEEMQRLNHQKEQACKVQQIKSQWVRANSVDVMV